MACPKSQSLAVRHAQVVNFIVEITCIYSCVLYLVNNCSILYAKRYFTLYFVAKLVAFSLKNLVCHILIYCSTYLQSHTFKIIGTRKYFRVKSHSKTKIGSSGSD